MSLATIITNTVAGLGGLGGLGVVVKFAWEAWKSREERQDAKEKAEAQNIDAGFSRLVAAAERQDAEISRLSTRDEENRGRIEKLEESNRVLARENRTFRDVMAGVVERLRRKPPDSAESILAYILTHLPSLGKDQS